MTISLGNRAKMSTSTTGTGTITLGSAVSGFQTFADAGITNGQTVRYAIDDGANFEIGSGTYTSSGTTLTRSVTESSNSDSAISLSGSAEVFIAATVADLNPLYAANESSPSAQPSATGVNAVAIGDSSVSSGADSLAFGDGATASSTRSTAIGYNATSSSINSTAIGPNATSSNFYTVAIGSPSNGTGSVATSAFSAIAINGYASGTDSFAAGVASNSSSYGASGANSVAIGKLAKATGAESTAIGESSTASSANSVAIGDSNTSSATRSVSLGFNNTAGGITSVAIGSSNTATGTGGYVAYAFGNTNTATGIGSVALGTEAKATIKTQIAMAAGKFAAVGDAQGSTFILRSDTTDATAEALTTNNSTAAADNQIVAASDTCITFHGTITAMQNGAQAYAGWEIKGMLVNDGGTTSLALGNVSDMAATNASSWAVALSADNTNNALKIQVTGEASHNIRWVANVQTAEVTYA
tara:strand:- start:3131 stop:4549 length:1419 start_codon:yes stop_codon:yes gene_type:complete